ncbi:Retrovirus-related Pol polyprotein from transposon RE2 [Cardamine amara subsp. amara]|uniref:Retrovirus-related Pol polyprotein from transposon RE2 n=1 Tax=Cardamine amara subsp. amara TaxID=228776 RepID=A0ABD1B7D6_CARAN
MEGSSISPSSSSLNISQCVILKLTSSNYLLWKTQFESFLLSQSLLGYVNNSTLRPQPTTTLRTGESVSEAPNPEFAKWVQNDQLVLAWLFGSLYEEALRVVYGLHTSQEV